MIHPQVMSVAVTFGLLVAGALTGVVLLSCVLWILSRRDARRRACNAQLLRHLDQSGSPRQ